MERHQSTTRSRDYGPVLRAIRTAFIDEWQCPGDQTRQQAKRLLAELLAAAQQGRLHELVPVAGLKRGTDTGGILPAGEIVQRMVADARKALMPEPLEIWRLSDEH